MGFPRVFATPMVTTSVGIFSLGMAKTWENPWRYLCCVVRPPDIVVGGLIFDQGFCFLSSFFFLLFRPLISELAERN